jgi:2-methylcitrate dehydratase PrpD
VTSASASLSRFALDLAFEDIPEHVVERAKACIIDTVADAHYGASLPWSRIILDYAQRTSAPGDARVIGTKLKLQPAYAAMANGAFAHAFELDSMCQPSVGAHPGASLTAPGLALAQTERASGKELITAWVAACEVMYRIGEAAHHSSERIGFHAPGLLGVFGGVVVAGRLMALDVERMTHALGIGGSLCSGLLEFSKSGGGMVKRLHQGRASEGAVTAASLARAGFTGPSHVLEGKYGFLNTFGRDPDLSRLTADLGREWRTLRTVIKAYACHSTAHVAVTAALALRSAHAIGGEDIETIHVAGSEKLMSHHAIHEPQDLAMAQYSAPFSVALAFYRDPRDPDVFNERAVTDPAIRALCRKTTIGLYDDGPHDNKLASKVTVRLKDGRELSHALDHFPGMPQQPLSTSELWEKFKRLTAALPTARTRRLFDDLLALDRVPDVAELEMI